MPTTVKERIEALREPAARAFLRALDAHIDSAATLDATWSRIEREGLDPDVTSAGYPDDLPSFDEHLSALIDWRDAVLSAAETHDAADPVVAVEIECSCTVHGDAYPGNVRRESLPLSEVPEIGRTCCLNAFSVPPGRVTRVEIVK